MRTAVALLCIAWSLGATSSARAEDELVCEDNYESCRETCTLDYGTSTDTRGKLMQCLNHCEAKKEGCLAKRKHHAKESDADNPKSNE